VGSPGGAKVVPPAPGENGKEDDGEGTGEADDGGEEEIGGAGERGGGGGEKRLDHEEHRGDPLEVGDVDGHLAGVGDEGEGEEEGGFAGDGETRGGDAKKEGNGERERAAVVDAGPPRGIGEMGGEPGDETGERVQIAHVGFEEGAGVELLLLHEENAAVLGVELGREQGPGFADGEDEGGEEDDPGGRARGEPGGF